MVTSAFPSGPSLFFVYLHGRPRFLEQAQGSVPQGPVTAIPGTGAGLWRVGGEATPASPEPRCPWG